MIKTTLQGHCAQRRDGIDYAASSTHPLFNVIALCTGGPVMDNCGMQTKNKKQESTGTDIERRGGGGRGGGGKGKMKGKEYVRLAST
jgi:hypothetical protein